jgi:hypothetical protein
MLDWLIHHDIAQACTALSVQEFLTVGTQFSYSPDFAPGDGFFQRLQLQLQGYHFQDVSEIVE